MPNPWISAALAVATCGVASAETTIGQPSMLQRSGADRTVYRCQLGLVANGHWVVEQVLGEPPIEIYLMPSDSVADVMPTGRRMRAVERERRIGQGRAHLALVHWLAREYAREHDGTGPESLTALSPELYGYQLSRLESSPYRGLSGSSVEPPFVFLIPRVRVDLDDLGGEQAGQRRPLAVELTPFVDDGRHWVVFTDGSTERVPIDSALLDRHGLTIRPVTREGSDGAALAADERYLLIAVHDRRVGGPGDVVLAETITGSSVTVRWSTSAFVHDEGVGADLDRARRAHWAPYAEAAGGSTVHTWLGAGAGAEGGPSPAGTGAARSTTSVFNVLGGRAAVRETVQLRSIGVRGDASEARSVPVGSLEGVTVASHPFAEMLGEHPGGSLPIAEVVPADRLLVYVARPEALMAFLEDGAGFLSDVGATVTGRSLEYDLGPRYLSRLGMDEQWLRRFLASGAVSEMALVFPDLFFIDGTEVSAVCRLERPALVRTLLHLLGVGALGEGDILERPLGEQVSAFWALSDDLLFVSTSRHELSLMLEARRNDGQGSLGRSAELRYMLTRLPIEAETRAWVYLSDPFIRRLVGPEVKIAQLRRVTARSEMEVLTALALEARLEGVEETPTVEALLQRLSAEHVPMEHDYSIDDDLVVHSRTYGTLADPVGSSRVPVTMVSESEAELYRAYVSSYNRLWRRYFDPIAMRLDDAPNRTLELETFILPLIDNSIYDAFKRVLSSREDGVPLQHPTFSPAPVLTLSLNLREEAWQEISKGAYELLRGHARMNPAILDDLGPGFHLAVHDGDPVIAVGSGDLLGAFGTGMIGRDQSTVAIPILLSLLTRPCTMAIETQNPTVTRRFLQHAATQPVPDDGRRRWYDVSLHQITGRDEWVFTMTFAGVIRLRYGLEVEGQHLMIRNVPWSSVDTVSRVETAELSSARLRANPGACRLQLPGLHAAASDRHRSAAADSMARLFPLLLSRYAGVDTAESAHMELFGYRPTHPGPGGWWWDGRSLGSTTFGTVVNLSSPPYDASEPVLGPFAGIELLTVGMQFEEEGLRTRVRWRTEEDPVSTAP
jgi:hypothetical protein